MALFTAIATAIFAGTALAGTFAVTAVATVLSIGASIGLSYVAKALAGTPEKPTNAAAQGFSVQGTLQTAGDVPRSFNVGYSVTAGSLVYANTWGNTVLDSNNTPNAYLTQVIALADLPGGTLQEIWVNGSLCTLSATVDAAKGTAVAEYNKGGADHLWVKYHDGTQTVADTFLTGTVSSTDRPYQSSRVGTGIAYVIVTALVDDTLWTGLPTFKFAVSGIKLYDPTKDDTNGGTGSHRYSDTTTWGGDGDEFPAVQIYNILRGFSYGGQWLYGLQNMTSARLPAINWNAQIDKCRETITGESGLEPTYRSGGQISVSVPIADTIEALLTACQGKVSEIGGFYKIHLGTPDSPSFSFTDDDILSTEIQTFTPFFGLANSINGITATYPDPAQGWNATVAPPLYVPDYEEQDGNRRLLANPSFDFVPYAAQVQRLMKSALAEARRARQHAIVMPPEFWIVEPGDVGEWTSTRNGYIAKQFRVDGTIDKANLDTAFSLTEVDPTDYDWDHAVDFTSPTTGPTIISQPAPQGIKDWFAAPATIRDSNGITRRPAIALSWDGDMPGVSGVQYEVRLASDSSHVARGRTDQLAVGTLVISQSLLPNTLYGVRGQYIPSAPRDMLWSDWLAVTTPNVRFSLLDFDAAVAYQVTQIQDALNDKIDAAVQLIASVSANQDTRNWLDKKEVRSQLNSVAGGANAAITQIQQTMANDELAFATFQTSVSATFGPAFSSVSTVSSAVATLNGQAAAQYAITLDVNGYASGFNLLNGGGGISSATFLVSKFQVASPGVTGGAAVPIFTVASVNGVPKVALRADVFVDGLITGTMIAAGTVQAVNITAGAITSDSGVIGALAVKSLSIGDNAVTVPVVQTLSSAVTGTGWTAALIQISTVTLSINTAGLAGKSITVLIGFFGQYAYSGAPSGLDTRYTLVANGVTLQDASAGAIPQFSMNFTSSYTFTASGGTDSVTIAVNWNGNVDAQTNALTVTNRTLWAVAAKR